MNAHQASSGEPAHLAESEPEPEPSAGGGAGAGAKLRGALIAVALFPLLAVLILNAQRDFDPFGTWINPLGLLVSAVAVAVIWAATGKRQG